jgi:3',5'-cyclic AMP phosphodiesterase CpdA
MLIQLKTQNIMKLVHISDLHIDNLNKKQNLLRARKVFEYIKETGYDHLVITGDITENGDNDSLELTRKTLKYYGMLDDTKTSLVIGNHDIYGGVHLAEEIVNFPRKCKTTNYHEKVKKFESVFPETFKNTFQPSRNSLFPYVKEFDNLILIGLNSVAEYSLLKNPFASNGKIKKTQIEDFENIFKLKSYRDKKKIVLIHHHFCKDMLENNESSSSVWQKIERKTMKLHNKKRLIKLFKKNDIDLVLHGHLHETGRYTRKGLLFLNAGETVLNNSQTHAKFNSVFMNSTNQINCEMLVVECYPSNKSAELRILTSGPNQKLSTLDLEYSLKKEICLN